MAILSGNSSSVGKVEKTITGIRDSVTSGPTVQKSKRRKKISFAQKYPELIGEWSKENEFGPDEISYGSNVPIIWEGACGHRWPASAKNRGHGSGCPTCTGHMVVEKINDLASQFPLIAVEWSARNYPLKPTEVTVKCNDRVWWKCDVCGYEYPARISDRTDGHGCPACAGHVLVPGINDFATEHKELLDEWSEKNVIRPNQVWSKSRDTVLWKCRVCGHEFPAVIDSRVKGLRCPACKKREREEMIPFHNVEEERSFKTQLIAYYAEIAGVKAVVGSDEQIGVELDVYFPERRAAIIYSRTLKREYLVRRERAKNWLCLKAGIRLFRILPSNGNEYDNCICITLTDKSLEVLSMAMRTIFNMLRIPADIDIERDIRIIKDFSKHKDRCS